MRIMHAADEARDKVLHEIKTHIKNKSVKEIRAFCLAVRNSNILKIF